MILKEQRARCFSKLTKEISCFGAPCQFQNVRESTQATKVRAQYTKACEHQITSVSSFSRKVKYEISLSKNPSCLNGIG